MLGMGRSGVLGNAMSADSNRNAGTTSVNGNSTAL